MAPLLKHNSELLFIDYQTLIIRQGGWSPPPPNLTTSEGNPLLGMSWWRWTERRGYWPRLSPPRAWPTLHSGSPRAFWEPKPLKLTVRGFFWSLWSQDHKPSPLLKLNARTMKDEENGFLCYIRVLSGRQFSNLCLFLDVRPPKDKGVLQN